MFSAGFTMYKDMPGGRDRSWKIRQTFVHREPKEELLFLKA